MHSSPSTQQIRSLLSRYRYRHLRTIADVNGNSNVAVISRRRPLPNPDSHSSFHDAISSSVFSTSARFGATHPAHVSAATSPSSMMMMYPASMTATDHYINLNNAHRARGPQTQIFAPSPTSLSPSATEPTSSQLQNLFLASAIPMVGFGFMDNFIMIQAGGLIDSTLGVKFGLATLTAAAMGQVVSDVSGVIFGGTIENAIARTGLLRPSTLTEMQRQLPICKRVSMSGAVAGVVVGCALGATSLLFVSSEDDENIGAESFRSTQRLEEVHSLLSGMFNSSVREMGCEECTLYLVDSSSIRDERGPSSPSASFRIQPLNASCDVESSPRQCLLDNDVVFENNTNAVGEENVSKMCTPVYGKDGSIVGVLEFRKKGGQEAEEGELGQNKRQMARVMANHVGVVLNHVLG